jgi:hypothetical protein
LASILALRKRRQAARLFLLAAPVEAGCFAWWQRLGYYDGMFSFHKFVVVFAGTAALLIVPGAFWLITNRWGWPPLIKVRSIAGAPIRQPIIPNAAILLLLVFACACASLYFPLAEGDCGGRPPVSVQTSPRQVVFTGRILYLDHHWFSKDTVSHWAVLRVDRVYWGLPRWMTGIVALRGYFSATDDGQEYFVDAHRSEGALTRFLPIVEHYPCCHTALFSDAKVDLRVLQDGPPKSNVRIIGRVYSFLPDGPGTEFVPGATIVVTGPAGGVTAITDQNGIYDLRDLPPGHYSVWLRSREQGGTGLKPEHVWETDLNLKPGDVWGGDLYLPTEAPQR